MSAFCMLVFSTCRFPPFVWCAIPVVSCSSSMLDCRVVFVIVMFGAPIVLMMIPSVVGPASMVVFVMCSVSLLYFFSCTSVL